MKSFRAAFFLWGNGTAIILKGKHPGAFVFPQTFHGSQDRGKQPRGRSVAMGKSVFSRIAAELLQWSWD
ncbi:MAG: hypothetical protein C6W57_06065 [Caldibacillus debilis]|nr:MAG: hypothetical protein C6W57_06065 [Caldibacillus debilis]